MNSVPHRYVSEALPLPDRLPTHEAQALERCLRTLWEVTVGRLGTVPGDLAELHRRYFNPVATGRTLRAALSGLEPFDGDVPQAARPLVIAAGRARYLPTPEARVALELLATAEGSGGFVAFEAERRHAAVAELLVVYRTWSRHRLDETVALINGRGRPLQLMPMGGVLTLLVNRADDPSRAIRRFPKGSREAERLDDAFFAPAAAFANHIRPRKPTTAPERLISGWTLREITVRVPGAIQISDLAGVYVEPERRTDVIDLLVHELRQRDLAPERVAGAFDALCDELSVQAPVLASFGFYFERPAATRRLRQAIVAGSA